MQKVISINLNGNSYQVDEPGYEALRNYLDAAAAHLRENPDRAEILADLEQALAEKCTAYLRPHKSVVTTAEAERIIAEMGPVRDPSTDAPAGSGTDGKGGEERRTSQGPIPRRLYQIREGAMITGVCNGLAAYFNIDVNIVRIAFVALALLTKGLWVIVYVAMSFFIPFANTAEERAAAHGMSFSAQDLIDRTKKQYRRQQREWIRQWRRAQLGGWRPDLQQNATYAGQVWARALAPVFGVIQALLFVLLAFAIVSLVDDQVIFGWSVPDSLPLWAGLLILVVLYQVLSAPFQAVRYAAARGWGSAGAPHGGQEAFSGLLSLAAMLFGFWLMYEYIPEVRDFVHDLPTISRDVWSSLTRR